MFRPLGPPTPIEPILLDPTQQPKPAQPAQQGAPLPPMQADEFSPLNLLLGSAGAVAATASSSYVDDDGNVQFIILPSPFEQSKPPDSPPDNPTKP